MAHGQTTVQDGQAERFTLLLCGNKHMMQEVRRFVPPSPDLHLQYASSPAFLRGRALFRLPSMVLLDATRESVLGLRPSLKEFSTQFPEVSIVALSNRQDHMLAVALVKAGVSAFYCLPADRKRLTDQIAVIRQEWLTRQQTSDFVEIQRKVYDFRHILGSSPALLQSIDHAQKMIASDSMTVLITGETGTGKELLARAIHYNSRTAKYPFVDIACSALPENLLESELFGYEKGAFTDAKERKIGLFEIAGEGSIFLDEIGDISMAMQSKLLKVIEDRVMRRIGGVRDIPVRARVIAATSADLEAKMRSGEFRRDLYHRLKILPLDAPPLRQRKEDIPQLIEAFLQTFNEQYGKQIKGIQQEALRLVMDQEWEGNVRELKHAVERAVLLEEGEWITAADFEFTRGQADRKGAGERTRTSAAPGGTGAGEGQSFTLLVPRNSATIANVQLLLVRRILDETGGNKVRAARILGISRPRLDRILRDGEGEEA